MSDDYLKITKFTGLLSGDNESFCFDVKEEDYERLIENNDRLKRFYKSSFYEGLYQVYPSKLWDGLEEETMYEFEIIVKAKRVTE